MNMDEAEKPQNTGQASYGNSGVGQHGADGAAEIKQDQREHQDRGQGSIDEEE